MLALSQLSYRPIEILQFSPHLVVPSPADPQGLVVLGGRETKLRTGTADRELIGQEVATLGIRRVRGDGVNLSRQVLPVDQTVTAASRATTANGDDVTVPGRPFDLHSKQLRPEVEDEVIAQIVDRPRDGDAELGAFQDDRRFCDDALLIRRQH